MRLSETSEVGQLLRFSTHGNFACNIHCTSKAACSSHGGPPTRLSHYTGRGNSYLLWCDVPVRLHSIVVGEEVCPGLAFVPRLWLTEEGGHLLLRPHAEGAFLLVGGAYLWVGVCVLC